MLGKPKPEKKQKKGRKSVRRVSEKGKLTLIAHAFIRDIVLKRDGACVCPPPKYGHSATRQAGHVIPSTKGGSRFSLWNIYEQCSSCNLIHRTHWQIYQKVFIDTFGSLAWRDLLAESENDGLKAYEIEEIIEQLQAIKERQLADDTFVPRFTQNEILSGSWALKQ